jgi:hypothetical protein
MSDESSGAPADAAEGTQAEAVVEEPAVEIDEESKTKVDKPTGIRLPGVQHAKDDADIFPELPRKDKDGKFVSRKQAEKNLEDEMRAEHDPEVGRREEPANPDEPKAAPEPPPKADEPKAAEPEKFAFAGKEYASKEEAEQSVRSMQGMFKPAQEEKQAAIDLAHQWRDYAMAQERRATGRNPEAAPQDPNPTAGKELDVESILNGINGQKFSELAQDPNKGLPVASRFLAAQVLDAVHTKLIPQIREEMMDELTKGLQPSREREAEEMAAREVANIYQAARGLRLTNGEQAFPELEDPETMMAVGREWANSGLPAEHAKTPRGLQQAIAMYRMKYGQPNREPVKPAEPGIKPTVQKVPVSEQATSTVSVGTPRETDEGKFGRAFDDADLVDPMLGFAVRKRR